MSVETKRPEPFGLQARALTGHFDADNLRNCPLGARAYIGPACNSELTIRVFGAGCRL